MIPLRDAVLFPGMMMPFLVGREHSLNALDAAIAKGSKSLSGCTTICSIYESSVEDIYTTGTIGIVLENLREEDGNPKVLVEGMSARDCSIGRYSEDYFCRDREVDLGAGFRSSRPLLRN